MKKKEHYHGLFSLCLLVKYIPRYPSMTGFPSLRNMEGVPQTYFSWGARWVFLSGTFCGLSPQPAASSEATPLLCQLLPRPPPSGAPPHCGRGQLLHTGYQKHIPNDQLVDIQREKLSTRHRSSSINEEFNLLLSYVLLSLEGKGPLHFGLCSTWLNTIKEGDMVPCFAHRYPSFHIPKKYRIFFSDRNSLTCFIYATIPALKVSTFHPTVVLPVFLWELEAALLHSVAFGNSNSMTSKKQVLNFIPYHIQVFSTVDLKWACLKLLNLNLCYFFKVWKGIQWPSCLGVEVQILIIFTKTRLWTWEIMVPWAVSQPLTLGRLDNPRLIHLVISISKNLCISVI